MNIATIIATRFRFHSRRVHGNIGLSRIATCTVYDGRAMEREAKSRRMLPFLAATHFCTQVRLKNGFYVCFGLFCLLRNEPFAAGQNESATRPNREGLIHLDVRISDETGRAIGDVVQSDLRLLDNNVPEQILSLRASNPADVNERLNEAALVLDDLDLPERLVLQAREDLIRYLRRNRHLDQQTTIYQLTSSGMHVLAESSSDGYALAASIMRASTRERRDSKPIDNWNMALSAVYSLAVKWREEPGRKALVWLGPSWPVDGLVADSARGAYFGALVELISRIRDARMVIYQVSLQPATIVSEFSYQNYAVGVQSASKMGQSRPHFSLQVLAAQSGGLLRTGGDDVALDLDRCVQDATTFYTLSFDPPPTAQIDEYHELKVQVLRFGGTARTSSAYYNQPVFYDPPRNPSHRLTVQQLDEFLQVSSDQHDEDLAPQLRNMELTERLSSSKFAQWLRKLHGRRSKEALTVLADRSVYLQPPASEVLTDPPPDFGTQAQMIKKTIEYLVEVLPMLPDFNAIRTLFEYDEHEAEDGTWKTAAADRSLREAVTEKATLFYRNGNEEQVVHRRKGNTSSRKDLNFIGIFGPILHRVLHDAGLTQNGLVWSRWERGVKGNEAVFQYAVHMKDPSYEVASCCLRNGFVFRTMPEYHGELAIDPETGAVLRLTIESAPGWIVETNLTPVRPVMATGMMLEYGPVQLGGRTFICPLRSVVTLRNRVVRRIKLWGSHASAYGPYATTMDDIAFSDYHKFGSESRILPGFEVMDGSGEQPK